LEKISDLKMNYILQYLRKHKSLSFFAIEILIQLGNILKLHPKILSRTRNLRQEMVPEYGLGFIFWFLMLRLKLNVPKYNVYQLVGGDEREIVLQLLQESNQKYEVRKQKYLLEGKDPTDEEFTTFIAEHIKNSFSSLKGNTSLKLAKFEKDSALNVLNYIDRVLKEEGISPFLISGTLLGIIRDGGFIENDNDLDIGVWSDQTNEKNLLKLLEKHERFRTVYALQHMVQVTDKSGIVVDVFIHYKEGRNVWHGTDTHRWYNSAFTIKELYFANQTYFIPGNPYEYLKENYGIWQTPVFFWDYSFDTPNQVFPQTQKAVFFLTERIIKELNKKNPCRYQVQTALEALKQRFDIDLTFFLGCGGRKENTWDDRDKNRHFIFLEKFDHLTLEHIRKINKLKLASKELLVGIESDELYRKKHMTSSLVSHIDKVKIIREIKGVYNVVVIEEEEDVQQYFYK